MKITERRIVAQDWYETAWTRTGWNSQDWHFLDDGVCIYLSPGWALTEVLNSDKYGNAILGIAEKETEI